MEKIIRDGKVAVLISDGYGAGWSTWNTCQELIFDATIVLAVEKNLSFDDVEEYLRGKYPEAYISCNPYDQLTIEWVEEGTQFVIDEYDGAETLRLSYETDWVIA